ncbi:hypothetical protein [Natrinema salifodinae]|nr:hypothetical protein [Natrinema salifodinae]
MSPPPTVALALLGAWVLLTFWATSTAATARAQADDPFEIAIPDDQSEHALDEPASENSFSAADD